MINVEAGVLFCPVLQKFDLQVPPMPPESSYDGGRVSIGRLVSPVSSANWTLACRACVSRLVTGQQSLKSS